MKPLIATLSLLFATAAAAEDALAPISGYAFMEPSTRELQDDDFLNPAFFLIDRGLTLWDQPAPNTGLSCRSCHQTIEDDMRGVAARYPQYDVGQSRLMNLEMKINSEIVEKLGSTPLAYDSEDLLAFTALIGLQSRQMPMSVDVTDETKDWLARGQEIFETKRGQLNLSCEDCHQNHWGEKLRGDTISQGQINAFPIFRLTWGEAGSRHRMFTWCMESIRSEPYAPGSDEYLALEFFLAVRGNGLPMEAPGVRR